MFAFLSSLFRTPRHEGLWRRDPLSHPDIKAMDERARGDLPFDPCRIASS